MTDSFLPSFCDLLLAVVYQAIVPKALFLLEKSVKVKVNSGMGRLVADAGKPDWDELAAGVGAQWLRAWP
jgi:hypothetical protein